MVVMNEFDRKNAGAVYSPHLSELYHIDSIIRKIRVNLDNEGLEAEEQYTHSEHHRGELAWSSSPCYTVQTFVFYNSDTSSIYSGFLEV